MTGIPESEQRRASILDRFSQGAREVLARAEAEARLFNHNYIGTEHLLLGLISGEPGEPAVTVLSNLGINPNNSRTSIEFIIGRGEKPFEGGIGLTPRARKVIEFADEESRMANAGEVTTLHLLRGLVREGEGIAAGVLESLGASLNRVRQQARLVQVQMEQEARQAKAAETLTFEEKSIKKLEEVLKNPNISQRTKTFIMGLVDRVTEFAAQEDTSEPTSRP